MKYWRPKPGQLFVHPEAMTAQQLLEVVEVGESNPTRRRDLKSAIRCIGRVLGHPLDGLPLDPAWLQPKLDAVIPGAHGLIAKTWGKRVSEFGQALKLAGIGRRLTPIQMDGPWDNLRVRMRGHGDKSITCWLSKFLRFAYLMEIQPTDVTLETIRAYEAEVRAAALNKDPAKAAYYAARMWDRAVETIDGWPQNKVGWADRRNSYCLEWSTFPATLAADVDAWLSRGDCDDIFADWIPGADRKPTTREKRRYEIQRFASALVHAGADPAGLISLDVLVRLDNVRLGMRWLRDERFGGKLTGGLQNIAIALAHAARWHARVDQEHQAMLNDIVRRCRSGDRGMTQKNQLRMEPFKDPALVRKYLELPATLFGRLSRQPNARRAAVLAETALAIGILSWCPIRIGNLREIEIERHLHQEHRGRRRKVYLVIPSGQVKNGVDIKFELPDPVIRLLDPFLADHRPLLASAGSRFLFSRRSGDAPIDYNSLALRIKTTMQFELGVDFSTHNFRHLAGLIWLLENPTEYEVVRRLLGHKAASTAMDFYVGLRTDTAHKAFTDLLRRYRDQSDA